MYEKRNPPPGPVYSRRQAQLSPYIFNLAGAKGFKPSTYGFGDHHSDLLSYAPMIDMPSKEREAAQ